MRHIVRCRSGGGRGREARERHGVTREGEPGTREPRGRRARASRVCASPQCRRRVKHKPPTLQRPQGEGGGTRRQAGTALSRWAQSRRTCPRVSVRVAEKPRADGRGGPGTDTERPRAGASWCAHTLCAAMCVEIINYHAPPHYRLHEHARAPTSAHRTSYKVQRLILQARPGTRPYFTVPGPLSRGRRSPPKQIGRAETGERPEYRTALRATHAPTYPRTHALDQLDLQSSSLC